jgi:hypothetical protein
VILDTTRATPVQDAKAHGPINAGESETPVLAERQPFDAFAEMAPTGPCFRSPCPAWSAEREPTPSEKGGPFQNRARLSMTQRKGLTFPNPLHKPPGRS